MPPSKVLPELPAGTVIHIHGFAGGGFAPKDKFLIIVGRHSTTTVLAFTITSNREYLNTNRARELVLVPAGSTRCRPKESFVKCFNEVERLDLAQLEMGYQRGHVRVTGDLSSFLPQIRNVVEMSDVLEPQDIEDVLRVIDSA